MTACFPNNNNNNNDCAIVNYILLIKPVQPLDDFYSDQIFFTINRLNLIWEHCGTCHIFSYPSLLGNWCSQAKCASSGLGP